MQTGPCHPVGPHATGNTTLRGNVVVVDESAGNVVDESAGTAVVDESDALLLFLSSSTVPSGSLLFPPSRGSLSLLLLLAMYLLILLLLPWLENNPVFRILVQQCRCGPLRPLSLRRGYLCWRPPMAAVPFFGLRSAPDERNLTIDLLVHPVHLRPLLRVRDI